MGTLLFSTFMSPYVPNSLPVPPHTACRQASHQRSYGWGMRQRSAVLSSRMNYTYATRPPMSPLYSTMRKSWTEALLKVCCGHATNEHGNLQRPCARVSRTPRRDKHSQTYSSSDARCSGSSVRDGRVSPWSAASICICSPRKQVGRSGQARCNTP